MTETVEAIAEASTTVAPEIVANASTEADGTSLSVNSQSPNSSAVNSIESSYSSLGLLQKDKPLSVGGIFWKCAINLFLPFINGMMLGFGEIFAHELGFRWGWTAARVYPAHRLAGPPGVQMVGESEKPSNRRLLVQS